MSQVSRKNSERDRGDKICFIVVSSLGLMTWVGIALFSGVREAWDSPAFGVVAFPLMIVVPAIAGAIRPNRFWLWGFAFVIPQPIAMAAMSPISDAFGGGLFFVAIFGLLGTLSAFVGWSLRKISDWIGNSLFTRD